MRFLLCPTMKACQGLSPLVFFWVVSIWVCSVALCNLPINRLLELVELSSGWPNTRCWGRRSLALGEEGTVALLLEAGHLFTLYPTWGASSLSLWQEGTKPCCCEVVLDDMKWSAEQPGTSDDVSSIWSEFWALFVSMSTAVAFCLGLQSKLAGETVHFFL